MNFELLFRPLLEQVFTYMFWLILLVMIISLLKTIFLPKLRGIEGERQVRKKLENHELEALHDIILKDNKNRLTQIDHLVKMPWGFLVIETKNFYGTVLGNKYQKKWVQRNRYTNRLFNNPLHQNYAHIKTVQELIPGVPVKGLVVFTDRAGFPKGIPEGVCQLNNFHLELTAINLPELPTQSLNEAWFKLKKYAKVDQQSRSKHLNQLEEKYGINKSVNRQSRLLLILTVMFVFVSFWLFREKTSLKANEKLSADLILEQPELQKKIIGYKEKWVQGRSIEECVGKDKELNESILRCRHGYKTMVPVYAD